jgi:rod shape-determining protein MreD
MRRQLALCLPALVLWAVTSELNHAISGLRVYAFLGALYLTPLVLPHERGGRLAAALAGLLCDATTPVAFGTHMFLFLIGYALLRRIRDRVPRDDALGRVIVTLLANLALFFAFSFTQIHRSPGCRRRSGRDCSVDLACSQILLVIVTPWYFALHARCLELARVNPRSEFA